MHAAVSLFPALERETETTALAAAGRVNAELHYLSPSLMSGASPRLESLEYYTLAGVNTHCLVNNNEIM